MELTEEQKKQLEEDLKEILQEVKDEYGFCGCYEGDIHKVFPEAKKETSRRIISLLKAWNLI